MLLNVRKPRTQGIAKWTPSNRGHRRPGGDNRPSRRRGRRPALFERLRRWLKRLGYTRPFQGNRAMRIPFFQKSGSKPRSPAPQDLSHFATWISGEEGSSPGHVLICGGSGTGKTTIAEKLAKELPGTRILFTSGSVPGWRELGLRGTFTDAIGHTEEAVSLEEVVSDRCGGRLDITIPSLGIESQVVARYLGMTLSRALVYSAAPRPCIRLIFDDVLSLLEKSVVENMLKYGRSRYAQVIGFERPRSRFENALRLECRWSAQLERPDSLVVAEHLTQTTRHYTPVQH